MAKNSKKTEIVEALEPRYDDLLTGICDLLDQARRMCARTVNSFMTAAYWDVGRRIVEYEQGGKARAEYGEVLLGHLARDLTAKHGRGFSRQGLQKMRVFYLDWEICPTPSGKFEGHVRLPPLQEDAPAAICPTLSGKSSHKEGVADLPVGPALIPAADQHRRTPPLCRSDAGQMNLYLNYLRENMMEPGENDPVGLILCSAKNDAVVHYAMGGIKAQVFASHYLTDLPDPETLKQELLTTQHALETRAARKGPESR